MCLWPSRNLVLLFLKVGHSQSLFLNFRLFCNSIVKLVDKILPTTGFEPRISGVVSNRCSNRSISLFTFAKKFFSVTNSIRFKRKCLLSFQHQSFASTFKSCWKLIAVDFKEWRFRARPEGLARRLWRARTVHFAGGKKLIKGSRTGKNFLCNLSVAVLNLESSLFPRIECCVLVWNSVFSVRCICERGGVRLWKVSNLILCKNWAKKLQNLTSCLNLQTSNNWITPSFFIFSNGQFFQIMCLFVHWTLSQIVSIMFRLENS